MKMFYIFSNKIILDYSITLYVVENKVFQNTRDLKINKTEENHK